MQMDGLLSVDDPVSKYVPEFTNKNQSAPVRLWHLMCHSGGFFPLPRIVIDKTAQEMHIEDSLENELIYRDDFAEEAEGWSFTVPTTKDGEFVSPAFVGSVPAGTDKGVRMYVKIPGHDWWHSEFVVLDGKIKYRATGGDQDRATGNVGQQVHLNFAKGTGEIK